MLIELNDKERKILIDDLKLDIEVVRSNIHRPLYDYTAQEAKDLQQNLIDLEHLLDKLKGADANASEKV